VLDNNAYGLNTKFKMSDMAIFFKIIGYKDMPHATAGNHLNSVASFTHNVGAMKRQSSGKTSRKRNDTIEH
jgi:hypothetical protein